MRNLRKEIQKREINIFVIKGYAKSIDLRKEIQRREINIFIMRSCDSIICNQGILRKVLRNLRKEIQRREINIFVTRSCIICNQGIYEKY